MRLTRRWVLAVLALSCGVFPAVAAAVGEPQNLSPPAVSGQPVVGSTLTTSDGSWVGASPPFAYQWIRCTPACDVIPGANANSYTVADVDRGTTIKSRVTASNAVGSTAAESSPVGPVAGGSGALAPVPTWARPALMSPFPRVTARAGRRSGGAALSAVLIRAMRGATVEVNCLGRGCPYGYVSHFLRVGTMRIVSLKQRYRAGSVIELRVTHPSVTGKYLRMDIGQGSATRTDGCVYPGSPQPRACG